MKARILFYLSLLAAPLFYMPYSIYAVTGRTDLAWTTFLFVGGILLVGVSAGAGLEELHTEYKVKQKRDLGGV